MIEQIRTVLVVGATGSIGCHVVDVALEKGYTVRALVRDRAKGRKFPAEVQLIVGDVTRPETLPAAVDGVDAVVFTLGSDGAGKVGAENIDYGGVRNVLAALGSRQVRIALMTSIGVTNRTGSYNRSTEAHDWKRRSERLVRASGLPYTIVRPGWFDYNKADEHRLIFLQGDTRQAGNSSDGVIARRQIAEVLVSSLTSDEALRKTFELVATKGPAQEDLDALFAVLDTDSNSSLDGVRDMPNQPLEDEPQRVKDDLHTPCLQTVVNLSPLEGRKAYAMKKCQLQLLIAGLIVLAQPLLAQNVKLANIALGMSETEVKTALASSAPFYINQASDYPDMHYLVAETDAESYAFTIIEDKVAAFSVVHILPPGTVAVPATRPEANGVYSEKPHYQADLDTFRNEQRRHALVE
jgi:uncharacterized protein YbjT (DUF2867 family)